MKEINYNGITVSISDDVLFEIREYIALHEKPVMYHDTVPYPNMAPRPSASHDHAVFAARPAPQEAKPEPHAAKRKQGIFSVFSKKGADKTPAQSIAADKEPDTFTIGKVSEAYREEEAVFSDTAPAASIDDILSNVEDTFQTHLLKLIDRKNLADSEVYRKADIDRRHFSKIRSNPEYRPKKQTAVALALALELNMDEAVDLLGRAGFAFSPSSRADLITQYCIEHEIYDLMEVNAILYYYDQPLLGGQMM